MVSWANTNATASSSVDVLVELFRSNVKAFVKALSDAGAAVKVNETRRSDKRAYLFHWCWKIGLGKAKATEAPAKIGVDIEWNHGNEDASKKGASDMITGFGLAVPPSSNVAPALTSRHIEGKAIDIQITWTGTIGDRKNKRGFVTVSEYGAFRNRLPLPDPPKSPVSTGKTRTPPPEM